MEIHQLQAHHEKGGLSVSFMFFLNDISFTLQKYLSLNLQRSHFFTLSKHYNKKVCQFGDIAQFLTSMI